MASSAVLTLDYGAAGSLNTDLELSSAVVVDLTFADMDDSFPGRPVPTTITVTSGQGTHSEVTASQKISFIAQGQYLFAFSGFSGVDFSDVDHITVEFDASQVEAVDFTIGPLTTHASTVPVQTTTWGQMKTNYRLAESFQMPGPEAHRHYSSRTGRR